MSSLTSLSPSPKVLCDPVMENGEVKKVISLSDSRDCSKHWLISDTGLVDLLKRGRQPVIAASSWYMDVQGDQPTLNIERYKSSRLKHFNDKYFFALPASYCQVHFCDRGAGEQDWEAGPDQEPLLQLCQERADGGSESCRQVLAKKVFYICKQMLGLDWSLTRCKSCRGCLSTPCRPVAKVRCEACVRCH